MSTIFERLNIDIMKKIYNELGLKEITNSRYEKNGTIVFYDPTFINGKIIYTFHKTGYYRRKKVDSYDKYYNYNYQLNPTYKDINNFTHRSMIYNQVEQMVLCINNISHYRHWCGVNS